MKTVFYKKVGKRYKPVSEYDSDLMSSLPMGYHLFAVKQGQTQRIFNINPDYVSLIAAGHAAKEAMVTALVKENTVKSPRRALTEEEYAAWENLITVWGDEARAIKGVSMNEVAEAGIKALEVEAADLLSTPAIKEAYEHFLFVTRLCYENKKTASG